MSTHTITVAELDEWLRRPQWQIFASCGSVHSHKRIETDRGEVFRVQVNGETIFLGADKAAAVAAYNEAQ